MPLDLRVRHAGSELLLACPLPPPPQALSAPVARNCWLR